MEAAEKGNLGIVKALLEKGADVNIQDQVGATALMQAAGGGNLEVVKLLLRKRGQHQCEDPKWLDGADMGCMERLIGCGEAS